MNFFSNNNVDYFPLYSSCKMSIISHSIPRAKCQLSQLSSSFMSLQLHRGISTRGACIYLVLFYRGMYILRCTLQCTSQHTAYLMLILFRFVSSCPVILSFCRKKCYSLTGPLSVKIILEIEKERCTYMYNTCSGDYHT